MTETTYSGVVSFVHHEKNFITIDYKDNEKKKSINCKVDETSQLKWNPGKGKKDFHLFRTGDHVNFQVALTDRGDRMTAINVKFLFNTALDKLLQKAKTENRFLGFIKIVEDEYFVKELQSYLFFPLQLSPWERKPPPEVLNDSVSFSLINTDKPNQLAAELFDHPFIPEYKQALRLWKNKTPIDAIISKVSPFAVYVDVISDKITCKVQLTDEEKANAKPGDPIKIKISFMNAMKIVVERA
jgi:hypothetical protein